MSANGTANGNGSLYEDVVEEVAEPKDASSVKTAEMPGKANGVHLAEQISSDAKIDSTGKVQENGGNDGAADGADDTHLADGNAAIDSPIATPKQASVEENIHTENNGSPENGESAHAGGDASVIAAAENTPDVHADNGDVQTLSAAESATADAESLTAEQPAVTEEVVDSNGSTAEQTTADAAHASEPPLQETTVQSQKPQESVDNDDETPEDVIGASEDAAASDAVAAPPADTVEQLPATELTPSDDAAATPDDAQDAVEPAEEATPSDVAATPDDAQDVEPQQTEETAHADNTEQPPAPTPAVAQAPAGLGLGLGLKLPPRAMRPPYTETAQDDSQTEGIAVGEEEISDAEADASQGTATAAAASSATAPDTTTAEETGTGTTPAPGASAQHETVPDAAEKLENTGTAAETQAAESSVPPSGGVGKPELPTRPALSRPSGLGSGLPLKAKPAVAKRAKSQAFAPAVKPAETNAADDAEAKAREAARKLEEEARIAAQQEAAAYSRAVERLPFKHATKTQEMQYLSGLVLQELKHLQAYLRQHERLSRSSDEVAALVEAGKALGLGTKLGSIQRYVSGSNLPATDTVNVRSLLQTAGQRGFTKLQQQLQLIVSESENDETTVGVLLRTLADKIQSLDCQSASSQPSDTPIEEVVSELDKKVEARARLEQQQVLQHIHAKDWSKSFSNTIKVPRNPSVIGSALRFIFGLPLLPFKIVLSVVRPSAPAEQFLTDQERLETRRFEARLKLLRAYQQAVMERTGVSLTVAK